MTAVSLKDPNTVTDFKAIHNKPNDVCKIQPQPNVVNKTALSEGDSAKITTASSCISCIVKDLSDQLFRKNPGVEMVDKTLEAELKGTCCCTGPCACSCSGDMPLDKFARDINDLTDGELDETKDHIAKKMANEPRDEARSILFQMYQMVDAEKASREWKFPKFPFTPPYFPIPFNPKFDSRWLVM